MKEVQRKQTRLAGANKTKTGEHPIAGESHPEEKQSALTPAASPTGWVRPTVEDVLQSMTAEQRKEIEDWRQAVMCPESETAKLTPEQKAQRDRNRAEKWPEYDAKMGELHKTHETNVIGGIGAIHARADEDRWFAENTPHQFKEDYHPTIVHFAGLSCRYLQEFARRGNEYAIREIAGLAVALTETMTDLLMGYAGSGPENAKIMQWVAEGLPYWPWLRFRHAAANNRQEFEAIAKLLRLGEACPINATGTGNWSLNTPINRFILRCLLHFRDVHRAIQHPPNPNAEKTIEQALEHYVFGDGVHMQGGMIHRDEIPIYKKSYRLTPLTKTKASAKAWADVAIMPYVKRRFPDLRKVEELRGINTGPTGKRYSLLRKFVIQHLFQLARKS